MPGGARSVRVILLPVTNTFGQESQQLQMEPRRIAYVRSVAAAGDDHHAAVRNRVGQQLAVGVGDDGLRVNTTWGRAETRTRVQLGSTVKGLSLKNSYGTYWALPIRGFARARDAKQSARIAVEGERKNVPTIGDSTSTSNCA